MHVSTRQQHSVPRLFDLVVAAIEQLGARPTRQTVAAVGGVGGWGGEGGSRGMLGEVRETGRDGLPLPRLADSQLTLS